MATPVADPADIAAVQDILKEVWTTDVLEDQLLNDTILLDWIDDVQEFTDSDGLHASVPLRVGRTGGIGSRGIGQKLPKSGHQRLGKAKYNYTFHYLTIKVLGPVIARMKTQRQSVVRELDLEVTNGLADIKQDFQRQLHSDGTAVIAKMNGSVASTTIDFDMTDPLTVHALQIGWVYEGMHISIGTLVNPVASVGGVSGDGTTIETIDIDAGTAVVQDSVTVTNGHFLFRHGNRDATSGGTSYELNGLGNIVGDPDAVVGEIDPAVASYWKPVVHHNSGTQRANSLDLMLKLENAIRRKGGRTELIVGDLDQERRYYNLLQSQVRYAGDKSLSGGNADGMDFHGKKFVGDPHCPPNVLRFLNKSALSMYSAGEIAWQNQTTGGDILAWVQDEDAFVARAAKYFQIGTDRRNTLGQLDDLLED